VVTGQVLYLYSERHTVKARNLAVNPRIVVHLESGEDVVIVRGTAPLTDVCSPGCSLIVLAMSEQQGSTGGQPDFAWIPQPKVKLFLGAKRKQDIAEGRSVRILVFPWGLTYSNEDTKITARWEEVTHVWQQVVRHSTNSVHTSTDYSYRMLFADGASVRFRASLDARTARRSEASGLSPAPGTTTQVEVAQLGRIIETAVTRAQLPKAIDLFNSGQPVSFGPLSVSRTGITDGDQILPWNEIEWVRTYSGKVSVKKSGKWLAWGKADVSQIPNYFVFNALVQTILSQQGRQPAEN
jgi:hypothetical protein